jgi:hypothetical protein
MALDLVDMNVERLGDEDVQVLDRLGTAADYTPYIHGPWHGRTKAYEDEQLAHAAWVEEYGWGDEEEVL